MLYRSYVTFITIYTITITYLYYFHAHYQKLEMYTVPLLSISQIWTQGNIGWLVRQTRKRLIVPLNRQMQAFDYNMTR